MEIHLVSWNIWGMIRYYIIIVRDPLHWVMKRRYGWKIGQISANFLFLVPGVVNGWCQLGDVQLSRIIRNFPPSTPLTRSCKKEKNISQCWKWAQIWIAQLGQFWSKLCALPLGNLLQICILRFWGSLNCIEFDLSQSGFHVCNALWARLNVKWEIGKCLPHPSLKGEM